MQLDARFVIDDQSAITISVPDRHEKETQYVAPQSTLHRFDIAPARFLGNDFCLNLYRDLLYVTIYSFYAIIHNVLQYDNTLSPYIAPGYAGRECCKSKFIGIPTYEQISNILIWGPSMPIYTFLYSKAGTIYLEISPAYSRKHSSRIPFEVYLRNYKPYVLKELPRDTVVKWNEQCNEIIQSFD